MSKEKIFKEGDYVFASKWKDEDPNDPWYVGTYSHFQNGRHYLKETGLIAYRNCRKITRKEGESIINSRSSEQSAKEKERIERFKNVWYSRNPAYENNADSGEDMFWKTAMMVSDDFHRLESSPAEQEELWAKAYMICINRKKTWSQSVDELKSKFTIQRNP